MAAGTESGSTESTWCWGVWVNNNGVYFDNPKANPGYIYVLDFMMDRHSMSHKVWRHLGFAWDVADDSVAVYLDGELGAKIPWGSKVSEMDCPSTSDKIVTLGRDLQTSKGITGTCYA